MIEVSGCRRFFNFLNDIAGINGQGLHEAVHREKPWSLTPSLDIGDIGIGISTPLGHLTQRHASFFPVVPKLLSEVVHSNPIRNKSIFSAETEYEFSNSYHIEDDPLRSRPCDPGNLLDGPPSGCQDRAQGR